MADIIYLNGHLVPRSEAKLSPFDRGFLYGYGLFETMRAYNGHIFRLDRHLARLRHSAEILGLSPDVIASRSNGTASPPSVLASEAKQSLETACRKTLTANGLKDARVRLTVSAGEGDMVPDPATSPRPTVLVTAESLTPLSAESYTQGFRAVLSSLRRNSQSPLSGLKSTCYLNNVLARIEARAAGCDEAIMLNERGYLAEGSSTNIFLVGKSPSLGGRGQVRVLITPSLKSGILPGITREAVLEIAQALNIEV